MKKILIVMSVLFLVACTAIDRANDYAKTGNYNVGLSIIQNEILKNSDKIEVTQTYENIFNNGQIFYKNNFKEKDLFNLEEKYLALPTEIKNKLSNISVDIEKHKKLGVDIAEELLNRLNAMSEYTYADKVNKYNDYNDVLKYDNSKRVEIIKNKELLREKIEKTYKIIFNGDNLVINYFKHFQNNLATRNFKYSSNPDTDLFIEVKEYRYERPNTTTRSERKIKTWKVKDGYGKEIQNRAVFDEITNIKSSNLNILVEYKLISNKTGETIFYNQEYFTKTFENQWKTYNLVSFSGLGSYQIQNSEAEKRLPNEVEILKELIPQIYKKINLEFEKLPYMKN